LTVLNVSAVMEHGVPVILKENSMAEVKKFGPYKGSKQNGGRPIYVYKTKQADGTWKTTSSNKARVEYEAKNGKLPKNIDVDHKDNKGRAGSDSMKNLQPLAHGKNVAKENKVRAGKSSTTKSTAKKATPAKKSTPTKRK